MKLFKTLKGKRGFTLVELIIVVAIIAILVGIGFAFINPNELSLVEANRNAESIATAAQNSLTALRNAGEIDDLQGYGDSPYEDVGKGGYRYIFSHSTAASGASMKTYEMDKILPFGSIDPELEKGYYVLGVQTDTGMVGEVFYSAKPLTNSENKQYSPDELQAVASDEDTRKNLTIGYYQGAVDATEIAFAQLPTPQLSINNYENLELCIYLPQVDELVKLGKQIALRVSLADVDDKAYSNSGFTLDQTAIYRTYPYGEPYADGSIVETKTVERIEMGKTYKIVLDTPAIKLSGDYTKDENTIVDSGLTTLDTPPTGKFAAWAKRSIAYRGITNKTSDGKGGTFKLGHDVKVIVTVFCLYDESKKDYANDPIDPTYMPRSGSVIFNGWFDSFDGSNTVTIACGRHLQNLERLTELDPERQKYLPVDEKGNWDYKQASRGKGYFYTDSSGSSNKYKYREHQDALGTDSYYVESDIKIAKQVKAIDFDCMPWKYVDAKNEIQRIPFDPINLSSGFTYYGNYLTIKHLYVNAPFYAGLFGYANGEILYDILLVNPSVTSKISAYAAEVYEVGVGGLIGTSKDSYSIKNCQIYMEEEGGTYDSAKYSIIGDQYVGGLIGFCEDEDIEVCSASVYTGASDGQSSMYVGGLIGCITGDSDIEKCYAAGNLRGQHVGGLVGIVMQDSDDSGDDYDIHSCYTAGHIVEASKSAAGLIGYLDEQGGYAKSALRCYQNYCVVIYGVDQTETNSSGTNLAQDDGTTPQYKWTNGNVPIYGTFEGDGFKWLYSDSGYFTGSVGGVGSFLGSNFHSDNENYFIPQAGIAYEGVDEATTEAHYATSSYYDSMKDVADNFLDELNAITPTGGNYSTTQADTIKAKIEESRQILRWKKQLDTLEEMKTLIERIIRELKDETGTYQYDSNGDGVINKKTETYFYRDGGFYSSDDVMAGYVYLDTKKCKIRGESECSASDIQQGTYIKLTAYQAMQAIYNGKYKDENEKEVSVTIAMESGYKETNNTFMSYYNTLKGILERKLEGNCTDEDNKIYKSMLGTDESGVGDEVIVKDEKGNKIVKKCYETGTFYANFYNRLFSGSDGVLYRSYRFFHKTSSSSFSSVNGRDDRVVGEETFDYFNERLGDRFLDYLATMTASVSSVEETLQAKKEAVLDNLLSATTTVYERKEKDKDKVPVSAPGDLQLVLNVLSKWSEEIGESKKVKVKGKNSDGEDITYEWELKGYPEAIKYYMDNLMSYLTKLQTLVKGLENGATLPRDIDNLLKAELIKDTNGNEILDFDGRPIYGLDDFYDFFYEIFNTDTHLIVVGEEGNYRLDDTGNDKGIRIKDLEMRTLVPRKDLDGKMTRDGFYAYVYELTTEAQTSGDERGTRGIRDMLEVWRDYLPLMNSNYYSGVEGAMDDLAYMCDYYKKNPTKSTEFASAVADARRALENCLAEEWGYRDSGHIIYTAAELRRIVRGMNINRTERHENDDFIINYGGYDQPSDYGSLYENNKIAREGMFSSEEQHYIDHDNGVYNNVFPYIKSEYTRYYPFPMIDGTSVRSGTQATAMLFHYGDWLTQDLWATDPALGKPEEESHKYHYEDTSELVSMVQDAIDAVDIIRQFSAPDSGFWTRDDGMGPYKTMIDDAAVSARSALETLKTKIEEYETNPNDAAKKDAVKAAIGKGSDYGNDTAYKLFKALFDLFDTSKKTESKDSKGNRVEKRITDIVDVIDMNYNVDTSEGMRNLRRLLGLSLNVLEDLWEQFK